MKRIYEEQFGTDFLRLSVDDDFTKELSFIWNCDSMVDVEIVIAFENEFGIKVTDAEATEMKTIKAIAWSSGSLGRKSDFLYNGTGT